MHQTWHTETLFMWTNWHNMHQTGLMCTNPSFGLGTQRVCFCAVLTGPVCTYGIKHRKHEHHRLDEPKRIKHRAIGLKGDCHRRRHHHCSLSLCPGCCPCQDRQSLKSQIRSSLGSSLVEPLLYDHVSTTSSDSSLEETSSLVELMQASSQS